VLRAVLFDFDGLILDTETPEVEILREVFAEHGQEFPDSYWIHALGRGADQFSERPAKLLKRLTNSDFDSDEMHREIRRRTIARIEQEPIRPGVEDLLIEIAERNLIAGVASSSGHPWVDGHLQRLGILSNFRRVVCAGDVPRAKPYGDLYLKLMEELGVDSSECFALEDSPNGVKGALAAGVRVIAVENPLSDMLDLSEANAKIPSLAGVGLDELWMMVGGG
jgi:HAD superfamily hydrolase (TIGR01509 family)